MFSKNVAILLLGLLAILIIILIVVSQTNKSQPNLTPDVTSSASPSASYTPEVLLEKQSEADLKFNNAQEEILKKYPWYLKLPIQEEFYFVYFDFDKNSFQANIYPQKSSPNPIDQQVELYQGDIIEKLKQIGVDTNVYQVEWVIIPE